MTTEKMTIHKALAELKIIGDRINNSITTTPSPQQPLLKQINIPMRKLII